MTPTREPPGPRGHWLLGDAGEFRRDPLTFLVELQARYGPVARFHMGPFPCYLLSDAEDVHTFLTLPSERIGKPAMVRRGFRKFFGDSLVVLEGAEHRTRRRLMQPAFHPKRVDGYAATMVEYSERALACWPAGESRDLEDSMMDLALEVIVKTMFGTDLTGRARELAPALAEVSAFAKREIQAVVSLPDWIPTPGNLRKRAAIRLLRGIVLDIVQARRAAQDDQGDLLAMLLQASEGDGARLSDHEVVDETLSFFIGGHEPSGLLMCWALYLIARHPAVERALHAELDHVLAGRAPTLEDLPRLKYTRRIVREVLRLRPPGWIFVREPIGAHRVGEYALRSRSTVFISPYVMHHDPRYYPDPARFDPDRFDDDFDARVPRHAYLPYGGGSHNCMGQHFASMQGVLVLATLVRASRFVPEDDREVGLAPLFGLGMNRRIRMRREPRTPAMAPV